MVRKNVYTREFCVVKLFVGKGAENDWEYYITLVHSKKHLVKISW